jgi:hypothetical protein
MQPRFEIRSVNLSLAVVMLWMSSTGAQDPSLAKRYESPDAYKIYSLLLPHEESYGFAKGTVIIQEETRSDATVEGACLSSDVANRFKDAISDYRRVAKSKWLLQRQFDIGKPYEIVSKDNIALVLKNEWDQHYDRYPRSGGYIFMSAVGFNKDRTLAIVYTGSFCGGLCGREQFHLLEKIHDHWKEVPAVGCMTVS